MRKRYFISDAFQHTYQRSIDGGAIFYSEEDYLVLFTILSVYAIKHNINIVDLVIMPDHWHSLLEVISSGKMSDFIQITTILFATEHNRYYKNKGSIISRAFGSASKKGPKKIRSIILYILNNPVEKKITKRAEDYRWNFMAYADTKFPFSKEIDLRKASKSIRDKVKFIESQVEKNKYLNYYDLALIFKGLKNDEKEYMIDLIIQSYLNIRFDINMKYYNTYKSLTISANANTGGEYEIKEAWNDGTDECFWDMVRISRTLGYNDRNRNFRNLKASEIKTLCLAFYHNTQARPEKIARFLHSTPQYICKILEIQYPPKRNLQK